MAKDKKNDMVLALAVAGLFLFIIFLAGFFLIRQYLVDQNSQVPNTNQQQTATPPVTTNDPTASWNVVNNTAAGFTFKYPIDFGSKYASFQSAPIAIVTPQGSAAIDSKGCYVIANSPASSDSQVTINNISFCLSTAEDPGAGQLYKTRNYTTLKNGNYITLQYIVHTLNGCSPYTGTPDYQPCTDFMNSYDTNVVKVIEASVGTLQFTK